MPAGRQSESSRVESSSSESRRAVTRLRRTASAAATLIAFAALAMLSIHVLLPQRTGPLVFTQIFEPYLLLALLVALVVFATLARTRLPLGVMLLVLLAAAGRYGPSVVAFPAQLPAGAQPIRVMSWNLAAGNVSVEDMSLTIDRLRPDIVGLIELVPARSRATDADERMRALFPYRVMLPRSGEPGIGLLSRFPVVEKQFTQDPALLRVILAPSDAEPPITVFVAHPFLDSIDLFGLVPDIQTIRRDADITLVRGEIDRELAAGHDVLVLADFNVTEREPAYAELTAGLHDAQREAGFGFGLTWRRARIEGLPVGLLRIDYLLASSAFVALEAGPDCTPRGSDHCLVSATFVRPRTR